MCRLILWFMFISSSYSLYATHQELVIEEQTQDIDQAILQERNEELKKLEQELAQLLELQIEVNEYVQAQGIELEVAHKQTEMAEIYVDEGTQNLEKSSEYKSKSRKFLFPIMGGLAGTLIAGPIGFLAGLNTGPILALSSFGFLAGVGAGATNLISNVQEEIQEKIQMIKNKINGIKDTEEVSLLN